MKFTLSEEDAATLGIPAEIEYDESRLGVQEAIALEEQVGLSVEDFADAFQGIPVAGPDGEPVWETDEHGKLVTDDAGKPVQRRKLSSRTLAIALWLGCRQSGAKTPFDAFNINLLSVTFAEEPEGKGNRASRRSAKKSTTTPRRSRTSSASAPGKSAA